MWTFAACEVVLRGIDVDFRRFMGKEKAIAPHDGLDGDGRVSWSFSASGYSSLGRP